MGPTNAGRFDVDGIYPNGGQPLVLVQYVGRESSPSWGCVREKGPPRKRVTGLLPIRTDGSNLIPLGGLEAVGENSEECGDTLCGEFGMAVGDDSTVKRQVSGTDSGQTFPRSPHNRATPRWAGPEVWR